mgnify:CR=1 FL=1
MVPLMLQEVSLIGILIFFAAIFYLLKKKVLLLKYTLMWIFSGLIMALVVIFPGLLNKFSMLVSIKTPSNALFAALIFMILMILISLTSIISGLSATNIKLIQSVGLLEKRVRELENMPTDIKQQKSS